MKENGLLHLRNEEIDKALRENFRQYFIGNLKRPQETLDYLNLGDLEIGSSLYQEPKADVPHAHSISSEILYILKGCYRVLLLESGQEYDIHAGDFFVIPPQTPYAGKAMLPMTQTLFVKTGGNDKMNVTISEDVTRWMQDFK